MRGRSFAANISIANYIHESVKSSCQNWTSRAYKLFVISHVPDFQK